MESVARIMEKKPELRSEDDIKYVINYKNKNSRMIRN